MAELDIEVHPTNLGGLAANFLGSQQQFGDLVEQEFARLGPVLASRLKANTPVGATGNLAASTAFHIERRDVADSETGSRTSDLTLHITQDAQPEHSRGQVYYWWVVAHGLNPRTVLPPPANLLPWVIHKKHEPLERAQEVARAISWSIWRRGTIANPYHLRTMQEVLPLIQGLADRLGFRLIASLGVTRGGSIL